MNGVACVNCAASGASCDLSTFTCTFNTGGGSAGGSGGGSATCDGCRLANGVCRPRNSSLQSNGICGSSGALCASCIGTATPICDNGACVAGVKRVGDACLSDVECASLGTGAVCKRASLAGNVTYAGGMCTIQNCSATAVCPIGSSCLNFPRIFGDEVAACYVTACSQTAPCRSGYTCFSVGNNQSGCLPSDFGNRSLQFDTTSVVGQACTLDAQCRAPTPGAPGAGGFCNPELAQRPNGTSVPTGNPGGFCSRDCRLDEDCTSDGLENLAEGICLPVSQTAAACVPGCDEPLRGQSNCRFGYVCEALTTSDGGQLATGFCDGRCDEPGGSCGTYADGGSRFCFPNGYCDFGGGRQDAG